MATKVQEFVAHGSSVNCLQIGRKSGAVMVTGGDDKKVNVWAVGKANAIMVCTALPRASRSWVRADRIFLLVRAVAESRRPQQCCRVCELRLQ